MATVATPTCTGIAVAAIESALRTAGLGSSGMKASNAAGGAMDSGITSSLLCSAQNPAAGVVVDLGTNVALKFTDRMG
jgi:predicted GNAT family acetyltransferase